MKVSVFVPSDPEKAIVAEIPPAACSLSAKVRECITDEMQPFQDDCDIEFVERADPRRISLHPTRPISDERRQKMARELVSALSLYWELGTKAEVTNEQRVAA